MLEKIISIIAEELEIDESEIKPNTNLVEDLEIESMIMLTLALRFEKAFNVKVSNQDIPLLKTPNDICEIFERKLS